MIRAVVVLGVVFLISACKFDQLPPVGDDGGGGVVDAAPIMCSGNGADPTCPADDPLCVGGQCLGACTSDADCAGRPANQAVCHVGSGTCVACDEDDQQAPPGTAEDECSVTTAAVCDAQTHACRACEAHDECASGVCDAGTCVAAANVIYMATTGSDNATCGTLAAPCLTLNNAIDKLQTNTPLKYIVMAPSSTSYAARNNTDRADFDVVAHVIAFGASVERAGDGVVVDVRNGANVIIEGLTIKNANGLAGDGVACSSSTLDLRGVTITANDNLGISGSTCALRLTRSSISSNRGGGIRLNGGRFEITNSFIVSNGNITTSALGGLELASGAAGNLLEFNTIALNASQAGAPDGVICTNAGLIARNNIIVGSPGKPHVNVGTNCAHRYTLFTPDGLVTDEGNMLVADQAMYMFEATTNFHIRAGSVAAGKAQSANLVGESLFDIDGDPRVLNGTTVDVGADEIP